jgi:membrane-associated phospholipid phosphatase
VKLPLLLRPESKYSVGGAMFAFLAGAYLMTNHFHLLPPQELPLTWLDRATPFMPTTLWVYVSEYVFFIAAYLSARDVLNLNRYVYAFVSLMLVSFLIFWAWPTTYPRALYPLPDALDPLTRYAFASLRETDTPANCLPSLHVSATLLTSLLFLGERRNYFPLFLGWALAIAISTLTTKQHYLADVISGMGLALIHYWIFFHWVSYDSLEVAGLQPLEVSGAQAKR